MRFVLSVKRKTLTTAKAATAGRSPLVQILHVVSAQTEQKSLVSACIKISPLIHKSRYIGRMASEQILERLRRLLKLAQSENPNESATAKAMADKLVEKYSISPEEVGSVADKKPLYGDDEKIYSSTEFCRWKATLAGVVGFKFDCDIVQEQSVTNSEGQPSVTTYDYFVYGDPDQAAEAKRVFSLLMNRLESILNFTCRGRGPRYLESYCMGWVDGVKNNLEFLDIQVSKSKESIEGAEKAITPTADFDPKVKPTENKTKISGGEEVRDVAAYFRGVYDGEGVDLEDALEIEIGRTLEDGKWVAKLKSSETKLL